jgi:hypothetical protein
MDADNAHADGEQSFTELHLGGAAQTNKAQPNNVLITAEAADLVRDGLRSQLARAAQDIADADGLTENREHAKNYQEPLRRMDAFRALLDDLGWNSSSPADVSVDVTAHEWALAQALQDEVAVLEDTRSDNFQDDKWRAKITKQLNALAPICQIVLKPEASPADPVDPRR